MVMGDGEVALTALEGPLRATFRLTLCRPGSGNAPSVAFRYPFAETPDAWVRSASPTRTGLPAGRSDRGSGHGC